jgi:hypothetical protein
MMTTTENSLNTIQYGTLGEIRLRKEQLAEALERDSEKIATMWNDLFHKKEDATKGEYIASLVTHSITAIDAFLLVRKLMKNYSGVLSLFGLRPKKKR